MNNFQLDVIKKAVCDVIDKKHIGMDAGDTMRIHIDPKNGSVKCDVSSSIKIPKQIARKS